MAIWSKEVFAKNLRYYMEARGISQRELAKIVGVSAPTMNEWLKGKKFPRIDKIEILAKYFGILKSELIEERTKEDREMQKNSDAIADIIARLRTDKVFLSVVKAINELDQEKLPNLLAFLK